MDLMRTFIATLLIVFSQLVTAGTVDNLYRAELTTTAQQEAPSQEELVSGLQQVLVKVSGRSDILGNPNIQQQLSAAGNFLQQYSYQPSEPVEVSKAPAQRLFIDFNQTSVDNLILHSGIKPLGPQRPTVLLWLASDSSGVQEFLNTDTKAVKALLQQAEKRGLPLQMPLFDLADQTSLPVSDLWGLFNESIEQASSRYRPDAVLAARIQQSSSGFNQVDWLLLTANNQQRYSTAGELWAVAEELVNVTANQLFQPVISHDLSFFQTGVAVHISNIRTMADYIQVTDYLKSLPVVSTVKPERVIGNDITVRLELDGSNEQLSQAMALEPRLQAMDIMRQPDGTQVLRYYWQE